MKLKNSLIMKENFNGLILKRVKQKNNNKKLNSSLLQI